MTDLHGRFREWLLAGAQGEPPRDAALHAGFQQFTSKPVPPADLVTLIEALKHRPVH